VLSPVGGPFGPPVAHAAPGESLLTRAPRRLAPVPGVGRTQRRTEGSNRIFRDGRTPHGLQNPVFPVYAGPGPLRVAEL